MKELDQIILQKGLFTSIKGHLYLTKGHLDNPEGEVQVESSLIGKLFLINFIYIKDNNYFFKTSTFNEASDPGRLIFLKQALMGITSHCPVSNYMFKVNNRNNRTMWKICSKLTIKTPERRYFTPSSSVFIVNFEQVNVYWVVLGGNKVQ